MKHMPWRGTIFVISVHITTICMVYPVAQEEQLPMRIHKAVIPAAGLGTRFLPYTKTVAKELVPILNVPALQYIIEEGVASGVDQFFIIANNKKQSLLNYLCTAHTAIAQHALLERLTYLMNNATYTYISQERPHGLGHAILMAKDAVDGEFFSVLLPDDIMVGPTPVLEQLRVVATQYQASIVAVQKVPMADTSRYGVIAIKKEIAPHLYELSDIIEKPAIDQAPSCFAVNGRYILHPAIFDALAHTLPGHGGEIQLTDGIRNLLKQGHKVLAYVIDGTRFDVGNPHGWLQANIYMAQHDPTYAKDIEIIRHMITKD